MRLSSSLRFWVVISLMWSFAAITGCAKKHQQTSVITPPTIGGHEQEAASVKPSRSRNEPSSQGSSEVDRPRDAKPLFVETGLASWYGPPYNHHAAADGQPYDMNQMTAAHKTLPLNSVVRVTNLKNGKSAILRISDRGPFVGDRIIDLSLAAAKQIDVWRPGVARVKVEVLEAPKPLTSGGRWAVQIGAFSNHEDAAQLKEQLARRYRSAKVIQFVGPTGEWVRLRPQDDDRNQAQQIAHATQVNEGGVFLVRLD
jgi:rare lipoprotein A